MAEHKRKKLNLSVKKYFQRWLLVRILGVTFLCSVIAALILYLYARNEITTSFFDAHIKIRRVSDLLLPVVLAGSLVSFISGILISIFLPQKIAGPIFRIEQDLKPIQEGDLTSLISLREGDILKDLAEEVNKATNEIKGKVQMSKDALADLIEVLTTMPANSDVQARTQELKNVLAQLKTR